MRLQDVKGDEEWSALEAELLRCAPLGLSAGLPGKQDCPEDTTDPDRRVRAALIRWLLLGGRSADRLRTHPKGVQLRGAWVDGKLDLASCSINGDMAINFCLFEKTLDMRDCTANGLYLIGSTLQEGLNAQRIIVRSRLDLCDGFESKKKVDLCNASVRFDLRLDNAVFCDEQTALNCDMVEVGGNWLFRNSLCKSGRVSLVSAKVGAFIQFRNSEIFGSIIMHAAISGLGFQFQGLSGAIQRIDLRHTKTEVLRDDTQSWGCINCIHLNGFQYDRIDSDTSLSQREMWLFQNSEANWNATKQAYLPVVGMDENFYPQPWTQLAKVLTASGDRRAASRVREVREAHMARVEIRQSWKAAGLSSWGPFPYVPVMFRFAWNALFRWMFGYGHAPARVFWWIGGLVVLTALLFGKIYDMGQMAPNSAVILTSADWQAALRAAGDAGQPLFHWAGMHGHPPMPSAIDYETFSRWLYAFDLFIPLDAIGQQQAWAPSHDRGVWGAVGYWARFPIQVAGWVIAAVGAAVVTGFLGKKDDG
jgi:hypothetical protein